MTFLGLKNWKEIYGSKVKNICNLQIQILFNATFFERNDPMSNVIFRFSVSLIAIDFILEMLKTYSKTSEVLREIDWCLTRVSSRNFEPNQSDQARLEKLNELLSCGTCTREIQFSNKLDKWSLFVRNKPGSPSDKLHCISEGGPKFQILYEQITPSGLGNAIMLLNRLIVSEYRNQKVEVFQRELEEDESRLVLVKKLSPKELRNRLEAQLES